ncbi:MAG: hypothetical protein ACREHD_18390 [Pirellulales bacterium]
MPNPQFSMTTLLWLTLVIGAFFAGKAVQRSLINLRPTEFYDAQPPME